jgi:hypothetical protein
MWTGALGKTISAALLPRRERVHSRAAQERAPQGTKLNRAKSD